MKGAGFDVPSQNSASGSPNSASGSPNSASDSPRVRPRARARYEARQTEIVDIAARLFAKQGYHATSVDDLVAATGLQRGGLYHYIGSKEELLFRIHERFIQPLLEEARRIDSDGQPPEERIQALAHALMRDIATYRDQVTVFLQEWRTIKGLSDPRAKELLDARRGFEAVLLRALREGAEQGIFSSEDPQLMLLAFLGMFNYSYQWFRSDGDYTTDQVASRFSQIFLDGIRPRS